MDSNQGPPPPVVYQPVPHAEHGEIQLDPVGMQAPVPVNVPPGLEYLTQIDQILVHQTVELLEAITGFETNNKYEIKNSLGQLMYRAEESNDCCTRNCLGSLREFDMMVTDGMEREVIRLVRPCRCDACCFPCCLQELEVQAPPGTTIGYVKQDWHPYLPLFSILGPNKETLLKLEGPCCPCSCFGDVNFDLKGKDGGEPIGHISKQWSGLVKEAFTDTDNFGIQFPLDLDVNMKAVLLGACFLIDFMYFEMTGDTD